MHRGCRNLWGMALGRQLFERISLWQVMRRGGRNIRRIGGAHTELGAERRQSGALNFLRHYFYSPAGGSSIGLRYRHRPERIQFTEIRRRKSRP